MVKPPRILIALGILGILEAVLRLFFYCEAVFAGVQLLQPMPPPSTMDVVNAINLVLGLAGLVVISGLLLAARWGIWGTVMVSDLTIIFDGVSAASVSLIALAGLILPILFLLVLIPRRRGYFVLHPAHE